MTRKKRSIYEVIDECRAVIPESQTEFLGALDILEQGKMLWSQRWEEFADLYQIYVGKNPTERWQFHVASVVVRQPIGV